MYAQKKAWNLLVFSLWGVWRNLDKRITKKPTPSGVSIPTIIPLCLLLVAKLSKPKNKS
jgi:hypothetical protein